MWSISVEQYSIKLFAYHDRLDSKLIDNEGAFVVGESFSCVFVNRHGTFKTTSQGDATIMDHWVTQHSNCQFKHYVLEEGLLEEVKGKRK